MRQIIINLQVKETTDIKKLLTELNQLEVKTTAQPEVRKEHSFYYSTKEIIIEGLLTFSLGITVGCMLFQLGTELLK